MQKSVNILGSTGSIGTSTLKIIRSAREIFSVNLLSAGDNLDKLKAQVVEFHPRFAAIHNPEKASELARFLKENTPGTAFLPFDEALKLDCDIAVSAIVGTAGLLPTVHAIRHAKRVALANKESLVAGGDLIRRECAASGAEIIPVDSEHNAIHQCLRGGKAKEVESLILTASGGPFFGLAHEQLAAVSVKEALKHPTWSMGNKVTIDSATLMNKGLEVIEAHFLFRIPYSKIRVKIHPQSVVHSMVEFRDGSILAQIGITDMQLPIQYALYYPGRPEKQSFRFPIEGSFSLDFHDPDRTTFRCLDLAYRAGKTGATQRIVLNSANEVAVRAFLNRKIPFSGIPALIEHMLNIIDIPHPDTVEEVMELDKQIKKQAETEVERGRF
ncbi:MAG: 1-deoxy-D-xylulose-5-phosphate reductoisomerase [Acidobacteria bacterium]|nr:1-deoxy-D-xylulose-5-phosphate reductoisomerase [Acidobacteriota bacterium]